VADRDPEDIKRDIEQSRAALAEAVDELAYRTNPKRVATNAKQSLIDKANTPRGRVVVGVTGALVVLLIVKRIRKH
jgi:osmotically-inducible protein OsmY